MNVALLSKYAHKVTCAHKFTRLEFRGDRREVGLVARQKWTLGVHGQSIVGLLVCSN